ncbi:hypothetical protein [Streptomyces sp. NPDC006463]|uniref:hypothetical protein n=1 Tax=Streptomyces sp. NPDC006463 TaxID=3364746 RepID=UPI003684AF06
MTPTWTTAGIFTGAGGVRTDEAGILTGEVSVRTTWKNGQAHISVQNSGAADWCTMTGSPLPCASEQASRAVHQSAVEAVRSGAAATLRGVIAESG